MESIVYTHGNKDDNKSSLEQTPVNGTFANLAESKSQSTGNNGSLFSFQRNQSSIVSEPKSDVLVDNSTSLITGEKNDEQTPAPLPIEPNKVIEPSKVIEPDKVIEPNKIIDKKAPQENTKSISLATKQDSVGDNSLSKDNQSLSSSPFTTLTSNNDTALNNSVSSSSLFGNLKDQSPVSTIIDTQLSNDNTDDEKGKSESSKTLISQLQNNNNINSEVQPKKIGQEATTTNFSFFPTTESKPGSPFTSAFTPTIVSTTASTSGPSFSFGSVAFNGMFSSDSNNNIERPEKMDKSSKLRRPYGQSMNNRIKRNKRNYGASAVSPFGSETENASSQLMWPNVGTQTQQTPTTTSSLFNTPSSAPTFNSTFGVNSTPASTTTFGFGTNVTAPVSAGFVSSATSTAELGNFFNISQNSTASIGFEMSSATTSVMQNGQPNNLSFQSNFFQHNQQPELNFNFNQMEGSGSGFNNPTNVSGGSQLMFEGGNSVHSVQQASNRKIRKMRSKRT
jgi:hypothetical protein